MTYVRKVRTASGAVAVQVARKNLGRVEIIEHVGSAHTDAELGVLLARARRIVDGEQGVLTGRICGLRIEHTLSLNKLGT